MSGDEHVARCRRWLGDQLEQLDGLRNASTRDPNFKSWRQNTLTVLQRIWPSQPGRGEHFRRIAFGPTGGKTDAATMREWFTRGCNDATEHLRGLMDMIDRDGVPAPSDSARHEHADSEGREDDFPVVELPSQEIMSAKPADAIVNDGEIVLDLGGSTGVPGRVVESEPAADANSPAPPRLQVKLSGPVTTPQAPKPAPAAPATPAVSRAMPNPFTSQRPAPPPASSPRAPEAPKSPRAPQAEPTPSSTFGRSRGTKSARGKKPPRSAKLRDLLGLPADDSLAPERPRDAAPPAPAPPAPASAPPVAATVAPASTPAPAPAESEPPAPPAPSPAVASGIVTSTPRPLHQRPKNVVSLESMISPELRGLRPAEPAAPPAAAEPAAPVLESAPAPAASNGEESADPALDPEAFARATEDFLKNSPVLGLQGRPVVRGGDGTSLMDPDAVALEALASEVGRLGVTEGTRASARAYLHELARAIESGEPEWSSLRDAVTFAMEYPELARRLLPIVLPWLEHAA